MCTDIVVIQKAVKGFQKSIPNFEGAVLWLSINLPANGSKSYAPLLAE